MNGEEFGSNCTGWPSRLVLRHDANLRFRPAGYRRAGVCFDVRENTDILLVLSVLGLRFVQGRADTLEVRKGDLRRRAL